MSTPVAQLGLTEEQIERLQSVWDKSKGIYRNKVTGRAISNDLVRDAIDAVADDAKAKLRALTQQIIDGEMELAEYATQAKPIVRRAMIASAQLAAGGRNQIDNRINGRIGNAVRFHLEHFDQFINDLDNGLLTVDQAAARADMYADASVSVFEKINLGIKKGAGYTKAKNILGNADHCEECLSLADEGWIDIEDMPPVGSRICLTNDRCRVIYK